MFIEIPLMSEPRIKTTTPVSRIFRRPKISDILPAIGTVTVVVNIYAVTTQVKLEKLLNSSTIRPSAVAIIV